MAIWSFLKLNDHLVLPQKLFMAHFISSFKYLSNIAHHQKMMNIELYGDQIYLDIQIKYWDHSDSIFIYLESFIFSIFYGFYAFYCSCSSTLSRTQKSQIYSESFPAFYFWLISSLSRWLHGIPVFFSSMHEHYHFVCFWTCSF